MEVAEGEVSEAREGREEEEREVEGKREQTRVDESLTLLLDISLGSDGCFEVGDS